MKSLFSCIVCFMVCFMVWMAFESLLPGISIAQSGISVAQSGTPADLASITLPEAKGQEFSEGVLLDNFEYSLHYQPAGCIIGEKIPGGWMSEYVWSYGLYGLYKIRVATTDDPETESRVLDTLVSGSYIFIPGYSNYIFTITKKAAYLDLDGVSHGSIPGGYKFMNVKIKLPQGTKADTFRFSVTITGNQYKLDDIVFFQSSRAMRENHTPYLFKIGPVYGQLWQPKGRFIFAEDKDLNIFLEVDSNRSEQYPYASIPLS